MEQVEETSVRHIGRYDVLGELGTGGMAVVYRAHDPRLDRDVAVKVLHPHLAKDYESRERFEREARAAARLRHPNIVEVYEFSAPDERESYMVTEILEGPTLRRFVEKHPDVPAEVAAAIGVVLCDALAAAHAQGVVHRDVKPDNLMLQRGKLKLTDFGIAHVADGHGMTVTGQVLGSPAHMAPEQIEGAAVDARTDIFATGTVLYLLSVGKLPFDGTTAHALLRKILDGEYVEPLRAAPVIGHRFAEIVRKALARVPADRYQSADALRAALTEFVREVGWEFPEQELQKYFEDPESFVAALKVTLKERLPQLGEDARRKGSIGDAMGYFNRALALDPGNAKIVALVRSVARRRQVERAARAAGIVTTAATITAVVALAALQSRVPPRPRRAPVLMPETGHVREVEPTSVIVHAIEGPRQEPQVVAVVDASVEAPELPLGPRNLVHRSNGEQHGARVANGDAGANEQRPTGETREVLFTPFPTLVTYMINDGPDSRPWSSQTRNLGLHPVGQRLTFHVTPTDGIHRPYTWSVVIPTRAPGEEAAFLASVPRNVVSVSSGADSAAVEHVPPHAPLN